jgi:hypothetical protein
MRSIPKRITLAALLVGSLGTAAFYAARVYHPLAGSLGHGYSLSLDELAVALLAVGIALLLTSVLFGVKLPAYLALAGLLMSTGFFAYLLLLSISSPHQPEHFFWQVVVPVLVGLAGLGYALKRVRSVRS